MIKKILPYSFQMMYPDHSGHIGVSIVKNDELKNSKETLNKTYGINKETGKNEQKRTI